MMYLKVAKIKTDFRAAVVVQLTQWSFPIPEVQSQSLENVIMNIFTVNYWKTKKKKGGWKWPNS